MKQLYKSAFSKQSQNDDNDDAKKTDGGMEWHFFFVFFCMVHSLPPVKRSGERFPLWLTDLERNARRKEVANEKK